MEMKETNGKEKMVVVLVLVSVGLTIKMMNAEMREKQV